MKNIFSLQSSCYDPLGNYILSLSKPKTTSYGLNFLFVTCQSSCRMRYLILFVPPSLLALKGESRAAFLYSRFSF